MKENKSSCTSISTSSFFESKESHAGLGDSQTRGHEESVIQEYILLTSSQDSSPSLPSLSSVSICLFLFVLHDFRIKYKSIFPFFMLMWGLMS